MAGWCRIQGEPTPPPTKAFVRFDERWTEVPIAPTLPLPQPVVNDAWCVFGQEETHAPGEHTTRLHIIAMGTRTTSLVVELLAKLPPASGAQRLVLERASIRLQGDRAVVFDLHGRVLVVALDERTVVREFRIS